MATITLPTTFVDGTIPTASQFNGDFSTIVNEINGALDNNNISGSAAISLSKIDVSSGLANDTALKGKETGGTARTLVKTDTNNNQVLGDTSGGHTVLVAGTSKQTVLTLPTQRNTTNAYEANMAIVSGWGVITGNNSQSLQETVSFPFTFSSQPIILITYMHRDPTASGGSGNGDTNPKAVATVINQGTSSFTAYLNDPATNFSSAYTFGYFWVAIGPRSVT